MWSQCRAGSVLSDLISRRNSSQTFDVSVFKTVERESILELASGLNNVRNNLIHIACYVFSFAMGPTFASPYNNILTHRSIHL